MELLDILPDGTVDLADLKQRLRPDTVLVAVTAVDSELGVVQPIAEIAELLKAYPNCHFHVDATQAVGCLLYTSVLVGQDVEPVCTAHSGSKVRAYNEGKPARLPSFSYMQRF